MLRRLIFVVMTAFLVMLVLTLTMIPVAAQDAFGQWASDAEATSQYGEDDYSALQATGEPDTDECGDAATAWSSATIDDPDEALTVYFETAVLPTQVNIHQTFNPGAITGISFITAGESNMIRVNDSADPGNTGCPGIHTINITWANPVPIDGVIIHLDQSLVGNWNEIDAVELVGVEASEEDFTSTDTASDSYEITGDAGFRVTCDSGAQFSNGVEVRVIQMRAGFTYTATAIGINGFDPVLAVLDSDTKQGLCTDDDATAANYSAWLPTTGQIDPSVTSSQVNFTNNSNSAFNDISLVVGGFNDAPGEFLLVLEGMAVTDADGAGDGFSMQLTPGMIASGLNPSVYMISVTNGLDTAIGLVDSDYNFQQDNNGAYYFCDDSGTNSCWGESYDMTNYYVSRTHDRYLAGGQLDAMLRLPVPPGNEWLYYTFLMRSSQQQTTGDYIVVFHIGIGN